MNGLENYGKCPKCGHQHSQFTVQDYMSPGLVWGADYAVETWRCINCDSTVERKHRIIQSEVIFESWTDDKRSVILIDNRPEKPTSRRGE